MSRGHSDDYLPLNDTVGHSDVGDSEGSQQWPQAEVILTGSSLLPGRGAPSGGLGQQVGDIRPPCTRDRCTVGTLSVHGAGQRGVPEGGPSSWIWQDTWLTHAKMKVAGGGGG